MDEVPCTETSARRAERVECAFDGSCRGALSSSPQPTCRETHVASAKTDEQSERLLICHAKALRAKAALLLSHNTTLHQPGCTAQPLTHAVDAYSASYVHKTNLASSIRA